MVAVKKVIIMLDMLIIDESDDMSMLDMSMDVELAKEALDVVLAMCMWSMMAAKVFDSESRVETDQRYGDSRGCFGWSGR